MKEQGYQSSFTANATPGEALEKIARVPEWWGTHFEGKSQEVNDVFTVRFPDDDGGGDRYSAKVVEILPEKKIIWEFVDTYQGWVKNPTEWVGTKIIWEVTPQKDGLEVKMTHVGLAPELECFGECTKAWNYLTQESLSQFLNEGKGRPV